MSRMLADLAAVIAEIEPAPKPIRIIVGFPHVDDHEVIGWDDTGLYLIGRGAWRRLVSLEPDDATVRLVGMPVERYDWHTHRGLVRQLSAGLIARKKGDARGPLN